MKLGAYVLLGFFLMIVALTFILKRTECKETKKVSCSVICLSNGANLPIHMGCPCLGFQSLGGSGEICE